MSLTFQAVMVDLKDDQVEAQVRELSEEDLPKGEVLIKVAYSSVNFKDGLAGLKDGKIVQSYPFIPGIDLSGTVVSSENDRFSEGDRVIATSYDIGVTHFGGYSEYAKIPADWVVPLPEGLSLRDAMIFGTAGFTAALSVHRLEQAGITPESGKVLVTGATGGVGSMAVAMLAKRGYDVSASTGKQSEHEFLKVLGAKEVLSRDEVYDGGKIRPLSKGKWMAAVDPVGGDSLAAVLSEMKQNGAVAVSGLTGGTKIPTTVHPFILRGVSLLGVDSAYCAMPLRSEIWARLGQDLKPDDLELLVNREVSLKEVPQAMEDIIESKIRGRVLVKVEE
ncbi:acrylyl-CoA reductase family protein [Jeotgalibacillus aurantiacus]|uniref:acrylyl-CoA reductase family protein n=1 Tax=Jeotgalibacillus aurantiacus TaxID=2763266 RepID=UPI001D0A12D1|nr:acryloyl-CoA reductase [Jeotgalibacillus aurantiacus]